MSRSAKPKADKFPSIGRAPKSTSKRQAAAKPPAIGKPKGERKPSFNAGGGEKMHMPKPKLAGERKPRAAKMPNVAGPTLPKGSMPAPEATAERLLKPRR